MRNSFSPIRVVLAIVCLFAAPLVALESAPIKIDAASTPDITVEKITYEGWPDALRVRNAACELVIVPQITRVIHFSLAGKENMLYLNRELAGKTVEKEDGTWHNFGGDKLWPAQQDMWIKYTKKDGWPPPFEFDGAAAAAEGIPGGVRLTTPQSPHFGAHAVREFVLDPKRPLVHVTQRFEKTEGNPAEMTLWSVTQVRRPNYALMPMGQPIDGQPFKALMKNPNHEEHGGFFVIKNEDTPAKKAGVAPDANYSDGWAAAVYDDIAVLKSHPLHKDGKYPDGNCPEEIFTADKGLNFYIELELLSPLQTVKAGEKLADEEVWQLVPLTKGQSADPEKAGAALREAHKAALGK
ncbi:MAG TPA: DUF4380 domain-containing protein [Planctomycetota bacterium]|nr:DUF4380 domain-containing protein [Planctomycetota bacterium]